MLEKTIRPSLSEVKGKLGELHRSLEKKEFIPCSSIAGGVPRGVICEVSGSARTEWVAQFLAQNSSLTTFWAEEKLTILPTALHQRGVDLRRVLIAEAGDKLFQAIRKALKAKLFECVVLPGMIEEIKMLKALQLFARESNACVILLSKKPSGEWAIHFQITATWNSDGKSFSVAVLKAKVTNIGAG